MAMQILYAGQDVSNLVQEASIQLQDQLGQGAGVLSGSSGRATTLSFLISGVGPASGAVGAGTTVTTPTLVRVGDVQVFDSTSTCIFGGKAVMLEDQTVKKTKYVKVSCVDWWQYLDSIIINKVYDGQTDLFIIQDLFTTYASWISQSLLPSSGSLTLSVENFQHFTLQKALQRIADKTGYNMWIDPTKHARYVNPTKSPTAPFDLSDTPNFTSSFQCGVDDYTIDDTAVINRVYFYGGKSLSNDLTQDLSNQADGANDLFVLAYYPHTASDGSFHLKVNGGADIALGHVGSTGAANTLIADGGTAAALINIDAHTIQWDVSTIPAGGASVTFKYRREVPLLVVVADNASKNFYGSYMDGVISDSSVFDQATAVRRCQTLLYEQSFGLETLQIRCWRPGIMAGQIIRIDHTVRNIHKSFIVQTVQVNPKGGGFFEYVLTMGAWHVNIVDAVLQLARLATPEDDSSTEEESTIEVVSADENVGMNLTLTTQTRTMAMYYPRLTPAGDGHDAYPGLFSI